MYEKMEALEKQASPGPWHAEDTPDEDGLCAVRVGEPNTIDEYMIGGFQCLAYRREVADAALAANAPTYSRLLREAGKALSDMMAVINESKGIDGWHLNGDTAEWGEFDFVGDSAAVLSKIAAQEAALS